jgi:hypothetical protein
MQAPAVPAAGVVEVQTEGPLCAGSGHSIFGIACGLILLALVSAGIFAAHILDAFRTGPPTRTPNSKRSTLRSRRSPTMPLQTPALWQSPFDLNSGACLLHVNDRFAP